MFGVTQHTLSPHRLRLDHTGRSDSRAALPRWNFASPRRERITRRQTTTALKTYHQPTHCPNNRLHPAVIQYMLHRLTMCPHVDACVAPYPDGPAERCCAPRVHKVTMCPRVDVCAIPTFKTIILRRAQHKLTMNPDVDNCVMQRNYCHRENANHGARDAGTRRSAHISAAA